MNAGAGPGHSPATRAPPASIQGNFTSTLTSPKRKASSLQRPQLASVGTPTVVVDKTNRSSTPCDTTRIRNDRLGALVLDLASKFRQASSWEEFVKGFRGPSYLSNELDHLDHPAVSVLRQWQDEGVPVHTSSPPWTDDQKDECIQRG